jgi:hypothetical protein
MLEDVNGLRTRLPALVAACTLVLAGCADDTSPDTARDTTPVPGSGSPDVRAAVDALAASLGVAPADVEVVAVEDVPWNDGSRGCAKPGRMYTMAVVEGSRITLRVDGTDYEYHSGGPRPPARCDEPTE